MDVQLNNLKLPFDYTEAVLQKAVAKKLRLDPGKIASIELLKRSIDARRRHDKPQLQLNVKVSVKGQAPRKAELYKRQPLPAAAPWKGEKRPVVIGAGPAGLFAALRLAEGGARPVILERGEASLERSRSVAAFWNKGVLNSESNVLYGEGGAGLFSDGKLTARTKDKKGLRKILETFVECGAQEEILYDAMPHIGTDRLLKVIPALRKRIEELGGEFHFGERLRSLAIADGQVTGIETAGGAIISTNCCILATGHSARDVYEMLQDADVALEPKPFAIGLRLELPQQEVDQRQYGEWAGNSSLGPAPFRLTSPETKEHRASYSFCMCPGGKVISCASEEGELTCNGMSNAARSSDFANAAFLVPIYPSDCPGNDPLKAGIAFQRELEQSAFKSGGGNFGLPAQTLSAFLDSALDSELPAQRSNKQAVPAALHQLLPRAVREALQQALPNMMAKLGATETSAVLLYGIETRSSSPLRILRNKDGQSTSTQGLYPVGEGAGYAGGIITSAIDGLRAADAALK